LPTGCFARGDSVKGLRIIRFRNAEVMRGLSAVVGKVGEVIDVLSISSNRGKIQP
jgi:very-short-patch-repair endonuclease